MLKANVTDVRKHFVVNQRSRKSANDFDKIKEEVSKLSDDNVKKEIYEKWDGGNGQANNFFLNDNLEWYRTEVPLNQIKSPYNNFRDIIKFQPNTKNPFEIIGLLKDLNHQIIKEFEDTDVNKIKSALPIFAVKKGDLLYVHDGWKRTLTIAFKGFKNIDAYLLNLKN